MAEELRLFLRTGAWILVAVIAYWLISSEPAGTVLLAFLFGALLCFVLAAAAFAPDAVRGLRNAGPVRLVGRLVGFGERVEDPPPLRSDSGVIPLSSAWPVVTAAALVVVGMGLVFGKWLLLPGIALVVVGGIGWLTQLD